MSELVERVARLICETENVEGFTCTCPDPFEPDWCHGNRAKAQARAVIAAIAEWLNSQVHSLEGLDAMEAAIEEIKKLRAECDRLKAALDKAGQFIADEYADPRVEPDGEWLAREARPIYAAICEALEGREWERLPNEKVAGVAALEAAGAGLSPASGQAPATDPAPAVCEWTPDDATVALFSLGHPRGQMKRAAGADEKGNCYICGCQLDR